MNPRVVLSPKGAISDLVVLYDGGEQDYASNDAWRGWSIAELDWYETPRLAVRWNGSDAEGHSPLGNPQSRGIPTWFILPTPLEPAIRDLFKYRVIFKPMSAGIASGQRGALAEMSTSHPNLESAQAGRYSPPRTGYIWEEILDAAGAVAQRRTPGQD
jgi:hypothetical protein